MRTDSFQFNLDPSGPGTGSKWVSPGPGDVYPGEVARQVQVFGAGTVVIVGADGAEDYWTFTSAQLPGVIPVAVLRVLAAGTAGGPAAGQTTTATLIKAVR